MRSKSLILALFGIVLVTQGNPAFAIIPSGTTPQTTTNQSVNQPRDLGPQSQRQPSADPRYANNYSNYNPYGNAGTNYMGGNNPDQMYQPIQVDLMNLFTTHEPPFTERLSLLIKAILFKPFTNRFDNLLKNSKFGNLMNISEIDQALVRQKAMAEIMRAGGRVTLPYQCSNFSRMNSPNPNRLGPIFTSPPR